MCSRCVAAVLQHETLTTRYIRPVRKGHTEVSSISHCRSTLRILTKFACGELLSDFVYLCEGLKLYAQFSANTLRVRTYIHES